MEPDGGHYSRLTERTEMAEIRQYVNILLESLGKKKNILQMLLRENGKQEEAIKLNGDLEAFDRIVETKGRFIAELELLDSGFEKIYDRVREELLAARESYKEEIVRMQQLISEITDLSVGIQTSEQRNKQLVENYFSYTKKKIRQSKKSVRAANDYYRNMRQTNYVDPQLLDKKK